MGFLLSIFMLVVFIILIIIVGGLSILRSLFFGGRTRSNANTSRQYNNQERNESQYTQKQTSKKKIISKDEGEYIDFEEMT